MSGVCELPSSDAESLFHALISIAVDKINVAQHFPRDWAARGSPLARPRSKRMKRSRSFLSGLRGTLLQLIGAFALLKTLILGVGETLSQAAETWRNLRSSANVEAMLSDMQSLGEWAAGNLSLRGVCEGTLAICAILVTNWLRVRLYVEPRRVSKETVAKRVKDKVPSTRKTKKSKKDEQNVR